MLYHGPSFQIVPWTIMSCCTLGHGPKYNILQDILTYTIQHSLSWEANRFAASQELPRILCNPKAYYRIQKCPKPVSILSQLDPVHTPTSNFLKIHPNIIIPSTPGSPQRSLSLRFPHQNPVHVSPLPHPSYMPLTSHSSRLYHSHNIGWGVQIIQLLIMYFSPFPCHLVPLRPKYSPQHPILKHPQPTFLPQCQRPSCTPIQNKGQNYSSVYLNLYIFG
jgi:hypothetical protein